MDNGRLKGAKQGLQTMLFYYLSALIPLVKDPKQCIATDIGKMIDLSEEQVAYVKMTIATQNKVITSLSSSIELLEVMEKTQKLDVESLGIVKGVLNTLKDECSKALNQYMESESDEQQPLREVQAAE